MSIIVKRKGVYYCMKNVLELIMEYGIVPVIKIPFEEASEPLAQALINGGLPIIEVTLRNDCALSCITRIKKAFPNMLVGAGTVISTKQVDDAKDAGVDFIVTPGFSPQIVKYCNDIDLPIIPGCVTPTEIEAAMEYGLKVLKFFPAQTMGEVEAIKSLGGPYGNIKFVPTSGITMNNINDYLSSDKVAAVGGSFMAPAAKIETGDFDGVTQLCKQAIKTSMNFKIAHVGINGQSNQEGKNMASRLSEIFDLNHKKGGRSDFAGTIVECCKTKFPGANGHIAIGTDSVTRAAAYLKRKGIKFREELKNVSADGKLISIYLEEEIGGFALHLVQN